MILSGIAPDAGVDGRFSIANVKGGDQNMSHGQSRLFLRTFVEP